MLNITVQPSLPLGQNTRIIFNEEEKTAVIVDPGYLDDFYTAFVEHYELKVIAILLTHMHIDHICGVNEVRKSFDVPIYGPHIADKPLLEHVNEQARLFSLDDIDNNFTPQWVEDGQVLQLFKDASFKVLHTKGHSPGSVCYYCAEENFILTGDTIFSNGFGRYDLEGGNREELKYSIENILLKLPDNVEIMSGHGEDDIMSNFKNFYRNYGHSYL